MQTLRCGLLGQIARVRSLADGNRVSTQGSLGRARPTRVISQCSCPEVSRPRLAGARRPRSGEARQITAPCGSDPWVTCVVMDAAVGHDGGPAPGARRRSYTSVLGNALFAGGDVRLIDFDDSGIGHRLSDVAVALWELRHRAGLRSVQDGTGRRLHHAPVAVG
jgi:Phosphotransferase enzyme family